MKSTALILLSALQVAPTAGFFPSGLPMAWGQGTSLGFGLPSGFGGPKSDEKVEGGNEKKEEKKISAGGLVQLITAGMGAPFLGDFEGVDEVSVSIALLCLDID